MNNYIKKININNTQGIIGAGDFETITINNTHKVFAWGVYIEGEYYSDYKTEYETINSFINFITNIQKIIKKKIYLYFHNLANFDGIFILNYLIENNIEHKHIIKDNQIYKIKIGNVIIKDFYKIVSKSLNKLANIYLNESKIEIDIEETWKDIKNNENIIREYLEKDVMILYKLIIIFENKIFEITKININNILTISSLAYKFYRANFLIENKIYNDNWMTDYQYMIIKNSYRGGITEIYKPKGENLYIYDINSSYPNVMLKYGMPVDKPKTIKNLENFKLEDFYGFLSVRIKIEKTYIPFLGHRNAEKNYLTYGYGIANIDIFSEELKYAMTVNKIKIIKVHTAISFKKEKIFTEYVNKIYKLKETAESQADKEIYKSLLNHLYGRFAMKQKFETTKIIELEKIKYYEVLYNSKIIAKSQDKAIITIETIIDKEIKENFKNKDENFKMIIKEIEKQEKSKIYSQTAVQIASAITAYARIEIDKWKRKIGEDNIWYSDTDSLVTNKKIETSKKIGGLKLENEVKYGIFLAPKTYMIKTKDENYKFIFKGVNINTLKKKMKEEEIENLYIKLYNTLTNQRNDMDIKINYINPIRKNFPNLKIIEMEVEVKPNFHEKKRIKEYNMIGNWEDTQPVNLNEK